ncbi:hypothetical protein ACFL96_13325 [Thermoproteota archaeon]
MKFELIDKKEFKFESMNYPCFSIPDFDLKDEQIWAVLSGSRSRRNLIVLDDSLEEITLNTDDIDKIPNAYSVHIIKDRLMVGYRGDPLVFKPIVCRYDMSGRLIDDTPRINAHRIKHSGDNVYFVHKYPQCSVLNNDLFVFMSGKPDIAMTDVHDIASHGDRVYVLKKSDADMVCQEPRYKYALADVTLDKENWVDLKDRFEDSSSSLAVNGPGNVLMSTENIPDRRLQWVSLFSPDGEHIDKGQLDMSIDHMMFDSQQRLVVSGKSFPVSLDNREHTHMIARYEVKYD